MENIDYFKMRNKISKICDELYKELDSVDDKFYELQNDYSIKNRKETITILTIKSEHIQEIINHLEEAKDELEWFTCVE